MAAVPDLAIARRPVALSPEGAARALLASPVALSHICQEDVAAVRGARIILALVARGELASVARAAVGHGAAAEAPQGPPCGLDRLGGMAVTAGED